EVSIETLVFQLLMTPPGPFFGAGRQEDLEDGGREYDRSHVPAVRDEPRGHCERMLALHERCPHRGHDRHARGALARLLGPDGAADFDAFEPDLLLAARLGPETDVQI